MTETPDKLCLKAEATGKLTFVTLANSLRKTHCLQKMQELADLDAKIYVSLQKLKQQSSQIVSVVDANYLNIFHRFVILLHVILC